MKKSKKIVLVVAAIIAIMASFIGGQVYAKYMSKLTGEGNAEIATWNFKVNDNSERMQTISLATTIDNESLSNYKIAPGTRGDFVIAIDTTGAEVGIVYQVEFENEVNKPSNLYYEFNGKRYESISLMRNDLSGIIEANSVEKIVNLNIHWEWPFETGETEEEIEGGDFVDTMEGRNAENYTFDVIVTGTQLPPNT